LIGIEDIKAAQTRLTPVIYPTPLVPAKGPPSTGGRKVYLKLENLQKTGSFKLRGAFNKIAKLDPAQRAKGVIAASAGNHAQGVACASRYFSIPAVIVMPETTPISKVMATKSYGAELVLYGDSFDEANRYALELAKERDLIFIPPFDDYDIIAGQGTVGLEILEQAPRLDTVVVPVGGGGLIAGIALALKEHDPAIKVVGVEAKAAASMSESLRRGYPCELPIAKTIADGIAVKQPGEKTFRLIQRLVDEIVLVEEEEIAEAILALMETEKVLVEGAGATPLAALMVEESLVNGEDVVLLISGGNIDVNIIARIIEKGLAKTGRLLRLVLELEDVPGTLNRLTGLLAEKQANILHIFHDRLSKDLPVGITKLELDLETRGREHSQEIINFLEAKGYCPKLIY